MNVWKVRSSHESQEITLDYVKFQRWSGEKKRKLLCDMTSFGHPGYNFTTFKGRPSHFVKTT
jgi:hypothetical protein